MARRVGYVNGFRRKFSEIAVIEIDVGNSLSDSVDYRGSMPAAVLYQNEQLATALSKWPIDVMNLGRADLRFARRLRAIEGLEDRIDRLPLINKIVSANAVLGPESKPPPRFLIKGVSGPRINGGRKPLRVAFIGVAEPVQPAEGRDGLVSDMLEASRTAVAEARPQSDLLVLIVHSTLETAARLAQANPEVDVVIAGNPRTVLAPRRAGKTIIVCAAPGNTAQGDLRIRIEDDGQFSYAFRSNELDDAVPSDPEADAFAVEVMSQFERMKTAGR